MNLWIQTGYLDDVNDETFLLAEQGVGERVSECIDRHDADVTAELVAHPFGATYTGSFPAVTTDTKMVTEWTDTSGLRRKVTTTKGANETLQQWADRHEAVVASAQAKWPVAS